MDEWVVLDIDASRLGRGPDESLIGDLAAECHMPFCHGDGVSTVEQLERIITLGVEKVAVSSATVADPSLIACTADRVGRQSMVVVIHVKTTGLLRRREVVTMNATNRTG